MSYIKRKGHGLMGFGDSAPACRTGDAFFQSGNWWVPIRDGDGKEYPLMQTPQLAALPKCAAAASSSGGGSGIFDSLIKGATEIFKAKVTAAPVTQYNTTASAGMSTTTKVALAGAGVLALAVVYKATRK